MGSLQAAAGTETAQGRGQALNGIRVLHHGAVDGVTGSCHELRLPGGAGVLVDCGLFQGAETSQQGAGAGRLAIDFPIEHIRALILTHVHIDHVGRLPYLLAAGYAGPIYCTEPSAVLLPLVLEDALEIGFTRDRRLITRVLDLIRSRTVALPYGRWERIDTGSGDELSVRLKRAGHILGSAYVECRVGTGAQARRVLFSGDLGAPYAPLLPAPRPAYHADVVVLESTYGDRRHEDRRRRRERLRAVLERALGDRGVVLIPAFSIGRTQELLYELEELVHRYRDDRLRPDLAWNDLEIIVDSPLASRFTAVYRKLKPFWDREARARLRRGRHPLSFAQLTTIDSHRDHLQTVAYLQKHARPCVVLAASGMCSGGRIVNYLKALVGDPRTDILFVGYQAAGTPGRAIQTWGPRGGYVELDGERYPIRARAHTVGGYSAHADQHDLVNFIRRMRRAPQQVRLVHGDAEAKHTLRKRLQALGHDMEVVIP